VGWYHTHTRSDILLCAQDLAIYDRFFPGARQIALVVRPDGLKPTRAGFFFRDAALTIHAESTFRTFILGVPEFAPSCQQRPAPAPAPAPPVACPPPAAPVVYRPNPPRPEPPRSFPHPARENRWHRRRGAIAAGFAGLLLASGLTSVESVLAARVLPSETAPAAVLPALPAPRPVATVAPPAVEASVEAVPVAVDPAPVPNAPPKPWHGLNTSTRRADPPALPQAPVLIAPRPTSAWPTLPAAAAPRRVVFDGGVVTFFSDTIVVADKKHPLGISLPSRGLEYTCESRTQSCAIAAAGIKLHVKHVTEYKLLMDYLTQSR
jgi:hypothetical protein